VNTLVLSLTYTECDGVTPLLQYALYRSMAASCTCCKVSGIDSKLSFSYLEDLFFHSYVTYRMLTANILSYSAKCCQLLESAVSARESKVICHPPIRACFLASLYLYHFRCNPVAQDAYPAIQEVKSNFPYCTVKSPSIDCFRVTRNVVKCWYLFVCIRVPRGKS
jgi:hypothetical protein